MEIMQGRYNATLITPVDTKPEEAQLGKFAQVRVAPMGSSSFSNINSNGTTTPKTGKGSLGRVTINKAATAGGTLTLYDNTAASGTVIALIDTTTVRTIEFGLAFATGLTAVMATAAADVTVVFD